ncbi:MAG: PEP/pyruvate-binding domain-containing protein [Chloroflexi bacterium]|nr:PEP/pyruvate-binding domain-containing protein [Chloroflexota bacterium]MBV9600598.1 PEP/pyruvate-binding domain-containing protein [Chloroflexota bacterium]
MASDPHILWLAECTSDREPWVGGKASGLGALLRAGLQVPPGFAITTSAYREHVAHNRLAGELERLLADCQTFAAQQRGAEEIRGLFEASRPTPALADAILAAYAELGAGRSPEPLPVAVRSSATGEDSATASFAGQQDTYLWILGGDEVLRHVVRCWASLFSAQAIAYRQQLHTPVDDLAMGVVVQRMVPSEAAGVMLTLDPITGDRSGIFIEAAFGLGAAVVNGEVDPDRFVIGKEPLTIRSRTIGVKSVAYRFDPAAQGTRREEIQAHLQAQPCMSDAEVLQIATLGKRMEHAMGRPQDIEWAIGPGVDGQRQVYLLQARPETVWSQKSSPLRA